ncbi:hypothetical protein Tco_0724784 [Tanacetum coccineum]|uniref:Uncharacterized protein n=1 Tax=Tanacetum coccineum TaxID=301880 RepID=A0ABQ4YCI9_9ASTR
MGRSVPGPVPELQVAERGSTRYEVLFQVAAGQSERDTWHLACVSTRSECVSTRSECVNPCQSWDNEAVGRRQKDENAPRSGSIIGWMPERTNLPLLLGCYINRRICCIWGC